MSREIFVCVCLVAVEETRTVYMNREGETKYELYTLCDMSRI